ncbi:hypothetical protein ACBI99_36940 [Nonomuraea sp. ATR24]|uniref:hypothetical protein n=1 Tax=Nonomuraea sp. ATR24 TaxID=1676744 RepID=UPI0035C041C7
MSITSTTKTVSRPASYKPPRRPDEPTYPLERLLDRINLSVEQFAEMVGISRPTAYRRMKHGVKWAEADDWAVAFGFLPYEIWPEWDLADPSEWCDLPPDPELDATDDYAIAWELLHSLPDSSAAS